MKRAPRLKESSMSKVDIRNIVEELARRIDASQRRDPSQR